MDDIPPGHSASPDLIKQFEAETGVNVSVDSFFSNEDALTKLQAGSSGYDIITPSQHFVKIMIDSGLLQDVDAHELDAYQLINENWRNQWWSPNNDYSIPLAYGTVDFAVNRDLYVGAIDSWGVYFEPPEELRGQIASLSYPDEVVDAAQLYLAVEFCAEESSETKKVLDLLLAQKPYVVAYTSDRQRGARARYRGEMSL